MRLEQGQELPTRTVHIDRARLVQYAGASLDRNPIHWDEHFARQVSLPDVIGHGMLTMALAVEVASQWVGDPGRIVECGTKFVGQVVVPYDDGADIEVSGRVSKADDEFATIDLAVTCRGSKVLGRTPVVVRQG